MAKEALKTLSDYAGYLVPYYSNPGICIIF